MPEHMHLVLGTHERRSFRYDDFIAYVRRVRERFAAYVSDGGPGPLSLSGPPVRLLRLVGALPRPAPCRRSSLARRLRSAAARRSGSRTPACATVARSAQSPPEFRVPRIGGRTLDGLRLQARLQVESRDSGEPRRELLQLEDGRGFARLPAPSAADVFFDIEGDPYWGDGRARVPARLGRRRAATARSGHTTRPRRRRAFESWIDWITERLARDPDDAHLPLQPLRADRAQAADEQATARARHEVDELLRRGVFVDLYAIVRQAIADRRGELLAQAARGGSIRSSATPR